MAETHLAYEAGMLQGTAQALISGTVVDECIHNALLESFAIHARALIDFLWPKSPQPDDVIAADYFDDPYAWPKMCPTFPAVLEPIRYRAGKEVAHLTYFRLAVADKTWPFASMAGELLAAFQVFINHVPAERVGTLLHTE